MRRIDIVRDPNQDQRTLLIEFVTEQTTKGRLLDATADRPVSDQVWLDLQSGKASDTIVASIIESGRVGPRMIATAVVTSVNDGWGLELVIDTDLEPDDRALLLIDLADTALDARRRDGGGAITWWIDEAPPGVDRVASRHGLAPSRTLHEMRRTLPHPERATIKTRPFDPAGDVDAWLAVNNRAFATHPEQGGWTIETLRKRFDEPWFDVDGFRVLDLDGAMAGFCWTKVHSPHNRSDKASDDGRLGEIYVIAVDPDFHGRRLGWELTLAGLDWLTDHGVRQAALYVDEANETAVRLYKRLGFEVHRTRHAFAGTLSPS